MSRGGFSGHPSSRCTNCALHSLVQLVEVVVWLLHLTSHLFKCSDHADPATVSIGRIRPTALQKILKRGASSHGTGHARLTAMRAWRLCLPRCPATGGCSPTTSTSCLPPKRPCASAFPLPAVSSVIRAHAVHGQREVSGRERCELQQRVLLGIIQLSCRVLSVKHSSSRAT